MQEDTIPFTTVIETACRCYLRQARNIAEWNLMMRDVKNLTRFDKPHIVLKKYMSATEAVGVLVEVELPIQFEYPEFIYTVQTDKTLHKALKRNANWKNNSEYEYYSLNDLLVAVGGLI